MKESDGLHLSGLSGRRGAVNVFTDVSFALTAGTTALLGPNGSGKSSLMKVIAGVWRAHSGDMMLDARQLRQHRSAETRSLIGYLPQAPTWHRWMKVRDVVEMFGWMQGIDRSRLTGAASQALDNVGLVHKAARTCGRLSGGEFQRLMLATAIVHAPRLLVLDEPTVGLDLDQRASFRDVIQGITDRGTIVLVSTHLVDDLAAAERVILMNRGRTAFVGTLLDLMGRADRSVSGDIERLGSGYRSVLADGGAV